MNIHEQVDAVVDHATSNMWFTVDMEIGDRLYLLRIGFRVDEVGITPTFAECLPYVVPAPRLSWWRRIALKVLGGQP